MFERHIGTAKAVRNLPGVRVDHTIFDMSAQLWRPGAPMLPVYPVRDRGSGASRNSVRNGHMAGFRNLQGREYQQNLMACMRITVFAAMPSMAP